MSNWTGGSRLLDAAPGERQHVGSLVLVGRPWAPSPYFNRLHSHASITSHIGKQKSCLNQKKDTKLAMLVSIQYQVRARNAGLVSQTLLFI